jgi:hypothetical protein
MPHHKLFRLTVLTAVLAIATLGLSVPNASAYGHADQPLAQIEFSANCNNPDFPLCFAPPAGFGLGGIWLWIEIDATGDGDVAGAGCGHIRGVGGGAGPITGEVTWWYSATPAGEAIFTDPNGSYYNVDLGGEVLSFPVTQGHYSAHPAPGVAIELQVAP